MKRFNFETVVLGLLLVCLCVGWNPGRPVFHDISKAQESPSVESEFVPVPDPETDDPEELPSPPPCRPPSEIGPIQIGPVPPTPPGFPPQPDLPGDFGPYQRVDVYHFGWQRLRELSNSLTSPTHRVKMFVRGEDGKTSTKTYLARNVEVHSSGLLAFTIVESGLRVVTNGPFTVEQMLQDGPPFDVRGEE